MAYGKFDIPYSLLETTLNTRDLGGYRSTISGKPLKPWSILRSDVQNYPSENDIGLLQSHDIRTVIDMRSEREAKRRVSGFAGREGFVYIPVPIEEGSGLPPSVDAVSESYFHIAESRNIVSVFRAVAAASGGVMINCTAGKDRTGVVSAVLLGVCGVSDGDIVYDYMLTRYCNRERFELIQRNFPETDMNIILPNERYMTEFIALLKAKYRSFRGYLTAIGITPEEVESIQAKLL